MKVILVTRCGCRREVELSGLVPPRRGEVDGVWKYWAAENCLPARLCEADAPGDVGPESGAREAYQYIVCLPEKVFETKKEVD